MSPSCQHPKVGGLSVIMYTKPPHTTPGTRDIYYFFFFIFITRDIYVPSSVCLLLSHVRLFATPWTIACQASLGEVGFSVHGLLQTRILKWVAISSRRIFLTQGSNLSLLHLLHCQADFLTTNASWEALHLSRAF